MVFLLILVIKLNLFKNTLEETIVAEIEKYIQDTKTMVGDADQVTHTVSIHKFVKGEKNPKVL